MRWLLNVLMLYCLIVIHFIPAVDILARYFLKNVFISSTGSTKFNKKKERKVAYLWLFRSAY